MSAISCTRGELCSQVYIAMGTLLVNTNSDYILYAGMTVFIRQDSAIVDVSWVNINLTIHFSLC